MGCESSKVDERPIIQKENTTVAIQYHGEVNKKEKMITLPREDRQFKEDGLNLDNTKERKVQKKPTKPTF